MGTPGPNANTKEKQLEELKLELRAREEHASRQIAWEHVPNDFTRIYLEPVYETQKKIAALEKENANTNEQLVAGLESLLTHSDQPTETEVHLSISGNPELAQLFLGMMERKAAEIKAAKGATPSTSEATRSDNKSFFRQT